MSSRRRFYRADPEYATGVFTETTGADISGKTIEVGLSANAYTRPSVWQAPNRRTNPTLSTARVSLLIDSNVALTGPAILWARLADSPEVLPRPAADEELFIV